MNVNLEQLGIDRLNVPERLELIGLIWDSIAETEANLPLPEWHVRELERRLAAADANPEAGNSVGRGKGPFDEANVSLPIRLRREAEEDLASGRDWYDKQRPGLGGDLVAQVDRLLDRINGG